jgi:hypothetical protein
VAFGTTPPEGSVMTPAILPVVDTWARDSAGKQCISTKEKQNQNNRNRLAGGICEWVMDTSRSQEMLGLYALVPPPQWIEQKCEP